MSSRNTTPYVYTRLKHPRDIRLVYVHEDLSIEIKTARHDEEHHYSALSYVWGTDPSDVEIEVVGRHSGTMKITRTLYEALQHQQWSKPRNLSRQIWVDAICINQNDLDEKGQQVRRMRDIYREADKVVVWLGPAAYDSDIAMDFIHDISVEKIDRQVANKKLGTAWRALVTLTRRPWFTRRWIIQEIAFARRAVLRCGTSSISWTKFSEAVTLLSAKSTQINQLFRACEESPMLGRRSLAAAGMVASVAVNRLENFIPTPLVQPMLTVSSMTTLYSLWNAFRKQPSWVEEFPVGEMCGVGAHSLCTNLDLIIRKDHGDQRPELLCTMETLISRLPTFRASNPRDVVFAITSLAKDASRFVPDYKKSVLRLYKEVIEQVVISSGSLNIICRPWAQCSKGPSWIPRLSHHPFRKDSRDTYVRTHADILVGLPGRLAYKYYKASASRLATFRFNDDENAFTLTATGILLSSIDSLARPASRGVVPSSWMKYNGDIRESREINIKQAYWRTLVADRTGDGDMAPSWYHRACEEVYARCGYGHLNTRAHLRVPDDPKRARSTQTIEFIRRVQAVTWNRRMAILEDGTLTLVPSTTTKEDRICILFGCDVPVVLRLREDGCWAFLGEAYAHGLMDGEALTKRVREHIFEMV